MKTLKTTMAILAVVLFGSSIIFISCNKDNDEIPTSVDNKLALPSTLENNTVLPVPDATSNTGECGYNVNVGVAESTIAIDKDGIISDATKLSIELDLKHQDGGDLVVQLITPSGDSCGLIKRIGATLDSNCGTIDDFVTGNKLTFNANFTNTTIANPIATGNYAPLAGTSIFPTMVPMISLSSFLLGKNIKGIWKIKVYDYGTLGVGQLNSWKLKFEMGALQ